MIVELERRGLIRRVPRQPRTIGCCCRPKNYPPSTDQNHCGGVLVERDPVETLSPPAAVCNDWYCPTKVGGRRPGGVHEEEAESTQTESWICCILIGRESLRRPSRDLQRTIRESTRGNGSIRPQSLVASVSAASDLPEATLEVVGHGRDPKEGQY